MMYVGLRYDPRKEHPIYLTGHDQRSLAEQMRREAIAFGYGRAERAIALTDGANGLEATLSSHFGGNVECVLDFWHASEHLHDWARRAAGTLPGVPPSWQRAPEGGVGEHPSGAAGQVFAEQRDGPLGGEVAPLLRGVTQEFAEPLPVRRGQQARPPGPVTVGEGIWGVVPARHRNPGVDGSEREPERATEATGSPGATARTARVRQYMRASRGDGVDVPAVVASRSGPRCP
jgi:hypothetical protein